jgi:hypothetical protein
MARQLGRDAIVPFRMTKNPDIVTKGIKKRGDA